MDRSKRLCEAGLVVGLTCDFFSDGSVAEQFVKILNKKNDIYIYII